MANINITGTTSATNSLTGALKVAGGISTKENLVVDQNLNVNGKSVLLVILELIALHLQQI